MAELARHGHLAARPAPLGSEPPGHPALSTRNVGLTPEVMARIPTSLLRVKVPGDSFAAALPHLRAAYCGTIAYEIEHIRSHRERAWLREAIESRVFWIEGTPEEKVLEAYCLRWDLWDARGQQLLRKLGVHSTTDLQKFKAAKPPKYIISGAANRQKFKASDPLEPRGRERDSIGQRSANDPKAKLLQHRPTISKRFGGRGEGYTTGRRSTGDPEAEKSIPPARGRETGILPAEGRNG